MKTNKHEFEEVDYDSMSNKEKIDFSNKIAEQYDSPKKSTRIKLFSGWLGWALSYGVGIVFVGYLLYIIFLQPSPEVQRFNETIKSLRSR